MISLAFRYLISRPRQTALMLLGFFFGAAAFVLLSGIMLGFRHYLIYQLINNDAHIHIESREEFLTDKNLNKAFFGALADLVVWDVPPSGRKDSTMIVNPEAWYERLSQDPRVAAYTPQLTASVILSKGYAKASTSLTGCDPARQIKVTTLGDYVTEGRFQDLAAGGNRIVLGDELRKKLGVTLFQNITVSTAHGNSAPFKVVSIFKTGNRLYDNQAYGLLADVQSINRTPNQVSGIAVRLHDYTQSSRMAKSWSLLGEEKIQSWDQKNANIFSVFRIQDAVRFLSIGAIMVVAGFGIYNVLNMTVVQKRKDIAILRSMGYSTGDVVLIFFTQGMLLGVTGTALGLLFGYGMSFYLETIPMGARGPIAVDHLLVSRELLIYVQAAVLALSSAAIASILPAKSAGELQPIQIIRMTAE